MRVAKIRDLNENSVESYSKEFWMRDIDKGFWMKIMEKATEGGEGFAPVKNCMLKYIERRLDIIIQSKDC